MYHAHHALTACKPWRNFVSRACDLKWICGRDVTRRCERRFRMAQVYVHFLNVDYSFTGIWWNGCQIKTQILLFVPNILVTKSEFNNKLRRRRKSRIAPTYAYFEEIARVPSANSSGGGQPHLSKQWWNATIPQSRVHRECNNDGNSAIPPENLLINSCLYLYVVPLHLRCEPQYRLATRWCQFREGLHETTY